MGKLVCENCLKEIDKEYYIDDIIVCEDCFEEEKEIGS